MNIFFTDSAWEDYEYLQSQDIKTMNKINSLLKTISSGGSIGKAEILKGSMSGWSMSG